MKTIQITMQLNFDGKITSDEEIKEVINNTMSAILDRANNGCISPVENENVSLKTVTMYEQFTGYQTTEGL